MRFPERPAPAVSPRRFDPLEERAAFCGDRRLRTWAIIAPSGDECLRPLARRVRLFLSLTPVSVRHRKVAVNRSVVAALLLALAGQPAGADERNIVGGNAGRSQTRDAATGRVLWRAKAVFGTTLSMS